MTISASLCITKHIPASVEPQSPSRLMAAMVVGRAGMSRYLVRCTKLMASRRDWWLRWLWGEQACLAIWFVVPSWWRPGEIDGCDGCGESRHVSLSGSLYQVDGVQERLMAAMVVGRAGMSRYLGRCTKLMASRRDWWLRWLWGEQACLAIWLVVPSWWRPGEIDGCDGCGESRHVSLSGSLYQVDGVQERLMAAIVEGIAAQP